MDNEVQRTKPTQKESNMSKQESATNASNNSAGTIISSSGVTFKRPESENSGGEITYIRLKNLKAGDVAVEGIYLGSSANKTYPEKLDFKFKTSDEKTVVVNEGGNLKYRMKDIEAGTLVLIKYLGMQKIAKGPRAGKSSHAVEVLVAD